MLPFRPLSAPPAEDGRPVVDFPPGETSERSERFIAEFTDEAGRTWIGNFRKGVTQLNRVDFHPNSQDVIVIAAGEMWIVDRERRTAQHVWPGVLEQWSVPNPERLVVTDGRSFRCLDARGEHWRTAALTERAGFDALQRDGERIGGKAWAVLTLKWIPFTLDLRNGAVYDGESSLDKPFDFGRTAGIEHAAPPSEDAERVLAVTRTLRRAAFAGLLALPVVFVLLAVLNKLTSGGMAFFVSGAPWTHVFWSALFFLMVAGVVLTMATLARPCPRCGNAFFASKNYARSGRSSQSRGTVNVFARRCINCKLPLKGART